MESRMVRRLVIMGVAVALVMAVALPARAGPRNAETYTARDFYTGALDANGDWKLVHCAFANLTLRDGNATETYKCQFEPGAVLPVEAVRWNYENTSGSWRWYSDVEDINNIDGDSACFMYTSPAGEPPGDSSWSLVITPSGSAHSTVKYRPAVWDTAKGFSCN